MFRPRRWLGPAVLALCSGLLCSAGGLRADLVSVNKDGGAAPADAAAPPSAVPNSFDEVTARLDRGGSLYLYWSLAQILDGLSGQIALLRDSLPTANTTPQDRQQIEQLTRLGAEFVKGSGLEQITGLGISSLELEPGVTRHTVFVHHDKGKETGLLNTLFGTTVHPLSALDFLPADTALASGGDYDLAALTRAVIKTIDDAGTPRLKRSTADNLQKFQVVAGMPLDEFLASLGQEVDLVLTLDPARQITIPVGQAGTMTIPLPRVALLIEVKDDKVFDRIDRSLPQVPSIVRIDEPDLKMRTFSYPATPDYELRASVARWDKFLVLASDDVLIRDIVATQKGAPGFKTTPLYAKLSPGLPAEGNGFALQTRPLAELILRYQQQALAAQQQASDQARYTWLQKTVFLRTVQDRFSVSGHLENGWLTVSKTAK